MSCRSRCDRVAVVVTLASYNGYRLPFISNCHIFVTFARPLNPRNDTLYTYYICTYSPSFPWRAHWAVHSLPSDLSIIQCQLTCNSDWQTIRDIAAAVISMGTDDMQRGVCVLQLGFRFFGLSNVFCFFSNVLICQPVCKNLFGANSIFGLAYS